MTTNEISNDPTTWTVTTWLLAIGMALGGGIINTIHSLKTGERLHFSFLAFLGEFFSAGFVGVAAFMALLSLDYSMGLSAFGACVTGHYSTRLLFKLELLLDYKFDQYLGIKNNNSEQNND